MHDKDFKGDFEMARSKSEQAADPWPCDPASEVAEDQAYGYYVFEEKGLLTAQEFYDLEGRLPTDASVETMSVPWPNPGSKQEMVLVNLKGLPLEVILSMRRVHIYYDSSARQSEVLLRPERQVLSSQGFATFEHATRNHMKERPDQLKPGAVGADLAVTKQKFQRKAHASSSTPAVAPPNAAAQESDSDGEDDTSSDSGTDGAAGPDQGIGPRKSAKVVAREQQAAKKKAEMQKKAAEKKAAKAKATGSADKFADLELRSGGSKNMHSKEKVLDLIDPDLHELAEAHLNSGRGSSVRCLANLRTEVFMLGPEEANVPEITSTKSLSAVLTGVRFSAIHSDRQSMVA